MGKVKIKKSDVWIDMTPMSDVMVLLLTFFMMTSTFVKNEPVKVVTPGSVTEAKVPESNTLNITITKDGQVFLGLDKTTDIEYALQDMTSKFGIDLNANQIEVFKNEAQFGVPMDKLAGFLDLDQEKRPEALKKLGIPTDSLMQADGNKGKSEFQEWIKSAKDGNPDLKLCIKADATTPYKVIKTVMSELQDMNENRYQLITSYKTTED